MARTPGTRGRGGRNGQRRRVEGVGLEFIPRFRAGWLRTCAGTGCAIGARGARGSEFDGIERLPAHPVERVGLGRARRLTHSAARGRDRARRDADCGGACACATCHVYVDPAFLALAGEQQEMEKSMLDFAESVKPNSRLSCQIKVTDALDGLRVTTPESQH